MKPDAFIQACPSRMIMTRLSDKWSMLILVLLKDEPVRFGELKRKAEGISQKVLTQTLRSLERDGLVSRTVYDEMPIRVEYQGTPFAAELVAIVEQVKQWSEKNMKIIIKHNRRYDARYTD